MAIVVGIFSQVLPYIAQQILMIPIHTGIINGNHDFRCPVFTFVNVPCLRSMNLRQMLQLTVQNIIGYIVCMIYRNRFSVFYIRIRRKFTCHLVYSKIIRKRNFIDPRQIRQISPQLSRIVSEPFFQLKDLKFCDLVIQR